MSVDTKIFKGTIIHCVGSVPSATPEVIEHGCLVVHSSKIIHVGDATSFNTQKEKYPTAVVTELTDSQILIPGLVDTHIHAPQYPNAGLGYDTTLLDWLRRYTFPTEAKYKDKAFAELVYDAVVKRTLAHGTTTACYFGTIFRETTMDLVKSVVRNGQRAYVGKVNMTRMAPDNYVETKETSISETKKFIEEVLAIKNPLVTPIITPRFAISVDNEMMLGLAELSEQFNVPIQSHISENKEEIATVRDLFGTGYAKVYDDGRLLTNRTVMAHGVHLTDDELKLLKTKGTSIAHCPASNTLLKSGVCDVKRLLNAGITVGLGSDVSGGPLPSIIQAMRDAITASLHLSFTQADLVTLTYADAFFLATMGGAKALSLDHKIGNFDVGKEFDALLVDMNVADSSTDYLKDCNPLELLQKFVFTGDDRNVISVFVSGKEINCFGISSCLNK